MESNETSVLHSPIAEFVDNRDTDIEPEEGQTAGIGDPEPWDPDKIRVHTKHYSLRQVVDMIADQDLDLAPDFQRQYVWKPQQQCGLIESILLGIPLPSFYFNEEPDGRLQVVDGVQRLTTISRFVNQKSFKLQNLTYLKDLEGSGFGEIGPVFRRRLQGSQLVAHVIDPQTPYRVKFDIFRRLNTGGSPLSAQEIRHCMSGPRSRALLKLLASNQDFAAATGGSLTGHPRMADREVILRFIAHHLHGADEYASHGSLDEFLGSVTGELDDQSKVSDEDLGRIEQQFVVGMQNARIVFGDHAFRFWPESQDRRNPINRALFEAWSVVLSRYSELEIAQRAQLIAREARRMMTADSEFVSSISGSTGDAASVRTRFARVEGLVSSVLASNP